MWLKTGFRFVVTEINYILQYIPIENSSIKCNDISQYLVFIVFLIKSMQPWWAEETFQNQNLTNPKLLNDGILAFFFFKGKLFFIFWNKYVWCKMWHLTFIKQNSLLSFRTYIMVVRRRAANFLEKPLLNSVSSFCTDALLADLESSTAHIAKCPVFLPKETPYSYPSGGHLFQDDPPPPPLPPPPTSEAPERIAVPAAGLPALSQQVQPRLF